MYLDDGKPDGLYGVVQGIRVVGQGPRIDHDTVGGADGIVQTVDDGPLVVRLERVDGEAEVPTPATAAVLQLTERGLPVYLGTADAEQIQVGSVDHEHAHGQQAIARNVCWVLEAGIGGPGSRLWWRQIAGRYEPVDDNPPRAQLRPAAI